MKLLVLAQIPPPVHGQSMMVQAMLDGLGQRLAVTLHHVNFRLSRDNADVGRWRPAKIFRTVALALRAIAVRLRHGCDTLYYVPAPGKRGALYRDWVVMALCRPFFRHLVLHWHAAGLSAWLEKEAAGLERAITRLLLGRADLSVVLAEALRADADYFRPRRVAVVANGVADPGPPTTSPRQNLNAPWQALFLGLGSEEKGLFAAADAIVAANRRSEYATGQPAFTLVAAGPFPDVGTSARFQRLIDAHPDMIRHVGFVSGAEKAALFAASHCLLFPTHYAAEALPLVVLEALAHDRPIVATRWRALPEIVTPECGHVVPVGDSDALVTALLAVRSAPPPAGVCRARYLREFTLAQHLARLSAAFATLTTLPETRGRELTANEDQSRP